MLNRTMSSKDITALVLSGVTVLSKPITLPDPHPTKEALAVPRELVHLALSEFPGYTRLSKIKADLKTFANYCMQ